MACKKCTSQKSVVAESKNSSSEQEIEQEPEEELVVESEEESEEESQKELEDQEQQQAATLANLKARNKSTTTRNTYPLLLLQVQTISMPKLCIWNLLEQR